MMNQQLLNIPSDRDHIKPKEKRKLNYVQKQVMNLTGGLYDAKFINAPSHLLKSTPINNSKWVSAPLVQQNKKLGEICFWQKEDELAKIYCGEKFNVPTQIIKFNKQQYEQISSDLSWSYEQTIYLFDLMQFYNLNFIVVNDRYIFGGKNKTIEQLKEVTFKAIQHYYKVNSRLLNLRGIIDHPLHSYKYDPEYEITRKIEMEKYLTRDKQTNDLEKKVIQQIRRLEIVIRKEEREQTSLKKALKLDQVIDEGADDEPENMVNNLNQDKIHVPVYTRQQYLQKPLPLPPKLNAKMIDVLQGLNIPDKVVANQQNQDLYDDLRKQVLLMFSAQRYIKKKQNQKRFLEQKKKKMIAKQQNDKKNSGGDEIKKKKGK